MGDDEPAEQLDPARVVLESLKVSTLKREPSVPAAAPQDVPRARCEQTHLTMAFVINATVCRRRVALWSS